MGFENILEAFYSNNEKGRKAKAIGQGNSLLNIRENLMNVIEAGREGFDTTRFKKLDKREKKWISSLESKYNRLVSDYASSYKNFLIESLKTRNNKSNDDESSLLDESQIRE